MQWTSADTLSFEFQLQGSETAITTVDIPNVATVSLPPVCLLYSPEFKPDESHKGTSTLKDLARVTGGKERVNLAGIWKDLPRKPRLVQIAHWLLILATLVFLAEVLQRRTGLLSLMRRALRRKVREAEPRAQTVTEKPVEPVTTGAVSARPAQEEKTPPPQPEKGAPTVLDAFKRARQRAKKRTQRTDDQ